MPSIVNNLSYTISCALYPDENKPVSDSFGYRRDRHVFMTDPHCKTISEFRIFLGAVSSAIPLAAETDNKAADYAVNLLLTSLADDYFVQPLDVAYKLNKEMRHEEMQAALAAIGIADQTVRILFNGNMAVLRIHDSSLERITPVKQSSFPETFFGITDEPFKIPARTREYPVCSGDSWILCTDTVTDPFTSEDGTLDTELIMQIMNAGCDNTAETLVRISSETYWPYYTKNLIHGCRSALVLKII